MIASSIFALLASLPAMEPCTLETPDMPRTEAQCGSVVVGVARDGSPLAIGFAVLEASGKHKAPDPIVLLPGGPGQASTELAGIAALAFGKARRDRDVVLFDPRGTGRSMKLDCHDERSLADKLRATDDEDAALIEACARSLPLDPREITTAHIARDLEAVRAALGVERWNLVGVSYGTRLALAYDRAFPGRARSLILDGVVPFSMKVGEHASADAARSLAALGQRADPEHPSALTESARGLRAQLDKAPADVRLADPTTGAPLTLPVDGDAAMGVVRMLVYAEETAAILPPILRAAAEGNLAPIAAQLVLGEKLQNTMSQPMHLSVLCAEDVDFAGDAGAGADVFPDFLADMKKACAHWPHASVDAHFHDDEPTSPTPALLLSGTADPVTPPAYAEAARKTLPNSMHVIAKGLGHNVMFRGCVPELVAKFLAKPEPGDLDVSCVDKLGPFPVFVDAMGPAP